MRILFFTSESDDCRCLYEFTWGAESRPMRQNIPTGTLSTNRLSFHAELLTPAGGHGFTVGAPGML